MSAIGISFWYSEEKINMLKSAAKEDDRTTSNYIQLVLENHIKNREINPIKKKRTFKRKGVNHV